MRPSQHKLLTCLLLATYAGISVLGQGLHWLAADDAHHHDLAAVGCVAHCHAHDRACVCHDHDACDLTAAQQEKTPVDQAISASNSIADSHDCEICEFLLTAISQPPQLAAPVVSQPLVATVPPALEQIYTPTTLSPHAARGPPQLLA